jgi:hypothetical protein
MLKLPPPVWALVYVLFAVAISWPLGWPKMPGVPLPPLVGPEATAQEIGPSSGFMSRQCLWCAGRLGRSVDHRQCVRI